METATTWFAFVGAWLLVAGPVQQAVGELRERNAEMVRIRSQDLGITPPEPLSRWWWLLPPVHVLLAHRRENDYHRRWFAALSQEENRTIVTFIDTASAWLYVGAGGFLLALRETLELVRHEGWATGWFYGIAVAATLAAAANVVLRVRRGNAMVGNRTAPPDAADTPTD